MSVTLRNLQRLVPVDTHLLLRQTIAQRNALNAGRYADHSLTVLLTSNGHMRRLNYRHARHNFATDVLTFRLADGEAEMPWPGGLPADLGTIVLAVPLCRKLAIRRGLTVHEYLELACAHAMAHLDGHDHHDVISTSAMRTTEKNLLDVARALTPSRVGLPQSYLP